MSEKSNRWEFLMTFVMHAMDPFINMIHQSQDEDLSDQQYQLYREHFPEWFVNGEFIEIEELDFDEKTARKLVLVLLKTAEIMGENNIDYFENMSRVERGFFVLLRDWYFGTSHEIDRLIDDFAAGKNQSNIRINLNQIEYVDEDKIK